MILTIPTIRPVPNLTWYEYHARFDIMAYLHL